MNPLSPESQKKVAELAQHYGISTEAVTTLLHAVKAGHGTMAQFSHPELGGPGQWSHGDMTMVGDMFNNALKAKVDALCSELADLVKREPATAGTPGDWWGADLGSAASTGSQNHMRYAYFPSTHRLAIGTGDRVVIYDTGDHDIRGVSQQQSGDASLTFVSQHGLVPVAGLPIISESGEGQTSAR
jgi:hypothetical protein